MYVNRSIRIEGEPCPENLIQSKIEFFLLFDTNAGADPGAVRIIQNALSIIKSRYSFKMGIFLIKIFFFKVKSTRMSLFCSTPAQTIMNKSTPGLDTLPPLDQILDQLLHNNYLSYVNYFFYNRISNMHIKFSEPTLIHGFLIYTVNINHQLKLSNNN